MKRYFEATITAQLVQYYYWLGDRRATVSSPPFNMAPPVSTGSTFHVLFQSALKVHCFHSSHNFQLPDCNNCKLQYSSSFITCAEDSTWLLISDYRHGTLSNPLTLLTATKVVSASVNMSHALWENEFRGMVYCVVSLRNSPSQVLQYIIVTPSPTPFLVYWKFHLSMIHLASVATHRLILYWSLDEAHNSSTHSESG